MLPGDLCGPAHGLHEPLLLLQAEQGVLRLLRGGFRIADSLCPGVDGRPSVWLVHGGHCVGTGAARERLPELRQVDPVLPRK